MRKGPNMTLADAQAHAKKHGYELQVQLQPHQREMVEDIIGKPLDKPREPRQNKTELSFGLILEAQKQRGEIVEYRPQGIRLAWGVDPDTGKPMWYTPDFYVVSYAIHGPKESEVKCWLAHIRIIEIKSGAGARKTYKDRVRFRGCRACWPMFQFELWQKKAGAWKRLE